MTDQDTHTDDLLLKAADMVMTREQMSAEAARQVADDDALREACLMMEDVRAAMEDHEAVDRAINTEEALSALHAKLNRRHWTVGGAWWWRVVAAAAVVAGFVWLLPGGEPTVEETLAQLQVPGDVELKTEDGTSVSIKPASGRVTAVDATTLQDLVKENEVEKMVLSVPSGQSADLTLPDGSVAFLHPGSRLVFPNAFVGSRREVMLIGQAYFRVTKDADHPFVVVTDRAETMVLGTEFDVRVTDDAVEVTLVSGSVKVSHGGSQAECVMTPGQQLSVSDNGLGEPRMVSLLPYKYWSEGILFFEQTEFQDIIKAVASNYGLKAEFHNESQLHLKMRFMMERNGSLEDALDLLNRMQKAVVYVAGNVIVVE